MLQFCKTTQQFYGIQKNTFLLFAIVVCGGGLYALWPKDTIQKSQDQEPLLQEQKLDLPQMDPRRLRQILLEKKKTVAIVDLRSVEEYTTSHIVGAHHLPLSGVKPSEPFAADYTVLVLPKNYTVSDVEAFVKVLGREGFQVVEVLKGGMTAWELIGGRVITDGNMSSLVDQSKVRMIDLSTLGQKMKNDGMVPIFVDVRPPEQWQKGHIAGAENLPLERIEYDSGILSPVRTIVIYGDNEAQVFRAAVRFYDMGFYDVYALREPFSVWQERHLPTTSR